MKSNLGASDKQKLIAVVGPTATGKTALAVSLAVRYGGEIITADSMQIYRGLDIGTAKASAAERSAVPHHLLDLCSPEQRFSAAEYVRAAREAVAEIAGRGKLPITAGGTGLYLTSLLEGIAYSSGGFDPDVRSALFREAEEQGSGVLYRRLETEDPAAAAAIHPNNLKRIVRALEFRELTGMRLSEQKAQSKPAEPPYDALILGLNYSDRAQLYGRIDRRCDGMLRSGLLDEAKRVYSHRDEWTTACQAIGYKEFFPYFEGRQTLEQCTASFKKATRNYAKRQLTWFGKMDGVHWLDASSPDPFPLVDRFLSAAG